MATATAEPALESLVHGSMSESCWGQVSRRSRFPILKEDATADVVVVGAGVAGLTTALELQHSGKNVVLLESKIVGSGCSGRSEGILTPWKRCNFRNLSGNTSKQAADSHKVALQYIKKVLKTENLSCNFKELDGHVFTYQGPEAGTLIGEEFMAARTAGLAVGEKLDMEVELGTGEKLDRVFKFRDTAVLDPVRYMDGLADAATKAGVKIYEQSRVRKHSTLSCTTLEGVTVTARDALVFTTGTPITKGIFDSSVRALALHSKHVPRRRYAVALSLPDGAAKEGVYFDLSSPPYCVRVSTSDAGLSLIVSGEDHDQGMPADQFADFYSRLEAWVRQKWPAVGKQTHQWSYQIFETADHLSFHGLDPSPGAGWYISTGDCGEALASATLGGIIISDQILGRQNEFSDLYSPSRSLQELPVPPIKPEYVKNTVQAVAKQVLPQFSNIDVEDLAVDNGAILQKGLHKLAVYKDDTGKVHTRSAVCPHLGCLIQWNPLEKQWNCPCHGSCFDKLGFNIGGGPATIDLKEVSVDL